MWRWFVLTIFRVSGEVIAVVAVVTGVGGGT